MVSDSPENVSVTIAPTPNGPYLVTALRRLRNSKGEELATQQVFALCRGGGSSNKPFCDGTHAVNGFDSRRERDDPIDTRDTYAGAEVSIHDNRGVCAHAGYCTDRLKEVFKLGEEPWIDPNGADVERIARQVRECPSGALSYEIDGVEHSGQARQPMITVSKDGPYHVVGSPQLDDPGGLSPYAPEHYTLCRCGGSKNKPFCDGTHWSIGFEDDRN